MQTLKTVAAVSWKPAKALDQFRGQLDTSGVYLETALENLASAAVDVKIAASGPCVENVAPFIFDLFKAALATPSADDVPLPVWNTGLFHILPVSIHF